MTIRADIVADSVAKGCPRITTFQLRYPRFIHSELMTHRTFSRNASSSRAIPLERLISDIQDDLAMPIHWGANEPGMQARQEVCSENKHDAQLAWRMGAEAAVRYARMMGRLGVHKQVVNRILEPYQHVNVVVTATGDALDHFFALRDHEDAQPEIQALARQMKQAMAISEPEHLEHDEWHLPYIEWHEFVDDSLSLEDLKRVSAARCASVSYKTVDGKEMTAEKALKIYEKLAGSTPIHASPFEHIAKPDSGNNKALCRNFTGWMQWRSIIEMRKHDGV